MLIKMAVEHFELCALLNCLLSPDNDVRTQAEEALNKIKIEVRALMLLELLHSSALSAEWKLLGADLLRRLISSEFTELEEKLSPDAMEAFKAKILLAVQVPYQSDDSRKKVCDIAAELATKLTDDDGNTTWPQFLQFLLAPANSNLPALQDSVLRMFTMVPGIFGNQEAQYLDRIKEMLQQSLLPNQAYEVRVQAVRAVAAFVTVHEKDTQVQKHFADLLPAMIEVIVDSIEQEDDSLLKCLIKLSEATPKYLRSQLQNIMGLCLVIIQTENMDEKFTQPALEVTLTLAETAPAMVRKVAGNVVADLIFQILKMMTIFEEEEDWSQQDTTEEDDASSPNAVSETALDRLACALGGKTILPQIISNIPNMLANPDWKYRHAVLIAISTVCKGCHHKHMEAMLTQIMDSVLNFLQDPHPRVRYAACNAVEQMSSSFAPIFQEKFHYKVIPGLLLVLEDDANPRTQAHAGAAMENFSRFCPKEILKMYLEPILSKLESLLISKLLVEDVRKLVLEQVVATIAAVSDSVEELFVPYYDRFMPFLKCIVENAVADEYKLLRCQTIECLSIIGLAVGPKKFSRDAMEFMDFSLNARYFQELKDDEQQISYLISAWARICKILGKNFQQYLPLVMGPVMKAASMRPKNHIQDIDADNDWEFVRQQKDFGINKANACQTLVFFVGFLKEGFANYVEDVLQLMIPLLEFYFHDAVRVAAAESLPYLLESGKAKGQQFLETMWTYICKELLAAIDLEPEQKIVSEFMISLSQCIETLGAGCLSEEIMWELIRILNSTLVDHFSRAVERGDKHKDEDYDEVVEEQLEVENYEDGYVLSKVTDVLHSLFSTYRTSFFPYFDQIVHHFVKLLSPDRPWADRQWALYVFADMIEYSGPDCVTYRDFFLPAIIQLTQDRRAEVQLAAFHGCGVLAQFGGDAFAQVCAEALPHLMSVIMAPVARAEENVHLTESAILAVTKILKYNNSAVNCDVMIPIWLSWLPVWEDASVAPNVYGYLCDLIEAHHPAVIGQNGANMPNIMAIFAEAFHRGAFESANETRLRVLSIIRQIQAYDETFNFCVVQLNDDQKLALHSALTATL